jgi:hypothetical protein
VATGSIILPNHFMNAMDQNLLFNGALLACRQPFMLEG